MSEILRKKDIKEVDMNKYITRKELISLLEIKDDSQTIQIISLLCKIKRIIIGKGTMLYNKEDVKNAIYKANQYRKEYYNSSYVKRKIPQKSMILLDKYRVPSEYSRILKETLNFERFVYKKEDVDNFLKGITNVNKKNIFNDNEEYVSEKNVCSYFDRYYSLKFIKELKKYWNIKNIIIKKVIYYNLNDILKAKEEINKMLDKYYFLNELNKYFNFKELSKYERAVVEEKYLIYFFSKNQSLIKKEQSIILEVEEKKYLVDGLNNNTIIPSKKVMEILNVTNMTLRNIIDKKYLEPLQFKSDIQIKGRYFDRKSVDNLFEKQQEFFEVYIDIKSANRKYGKNIRFSRVKGINFYDIPIYAYKKDKALSLSASGNKVLKIKEIEEHISSLQIKQDNINIDNITNFEKFKIKLNENIKWKGFRKDSSYTETTWMNYVKSILDKTISQNEHLSKLVNKYIRATFELIDLLDKNNKSEIYMVSSNEINMYFRTIYKTRAAVLYYYFYSIYSEMMLLKNHPKIAFTISELNHPHLKNKEDYNKKKDEENDLNIEEVYEFETYSQVLNYCLDINLHVKKSLDEIKKHNTAKYASTWLYVLLHLNNAWRNGDVNNFPTVNISDILKENNINNLDWFIKNKIDLNISRKIITRVINHEIIISKTQVKGTFFCSDSLAPTFATAVSILSLFNKVIDGNLMIFGTKFNNINRILLEKYFKCFKIPNFKFSSRKFNKSIITYIYYASNILGDEKSLLYTQKIRAHINPESTLHYINIDLKKFDEMSQQLFIRGEFGFIAESLLKKINNNKLVFDDITKEINHLNKAFGDLIKINATNSLLNQMRYERENIINLLNKSSFEECQKLIYKLYTNNLPSKCGKEVKCIISGNKCERPDIDDCFECSYHIPSIYSLTFLYQSIMEDIKIINSSKNFPRKNRALCSLERKKIIMLEALNKFGKDYVYACLNIDRNKFINDISVATLNNNFI